MDLTALITRGFAMSDRILCLRVMERGACSTSRLSPDDWYPVSASAEDARQEAADAIAVCASCRVRAECLELAVRNWAVGQHGVWGGTVPADRERLRSGRVAQLTRVLARNRNSDLAANRDADRAASLYRFRPPTGAPCGRLIRGATPIRTSPQIRDRAAGPVIAPPSAWRGPRTGRP
jgi:Transcription factor WhiB